MKLILVALLITLVGCTDSNETDFYLCKEETKVLIKEFSISCLEKHSASFNNTIKTFDKAATTTTSRAYSYNDRVKHTFQDFNNTYGSIVNECSYAAKRMFCMEPRQNKKKEKD